MWSLSQTAFSPTSQSVSYQSVKVFTVKDHSDLASAISSSEDTPFPCVQQHSIPELFGPFIYGKSGLWLCAVDQYN